MDQSSSAMSSSATTVKEPRTMSPDLPPIPDEMAMRGIFQLKRALIACGGSASAAEWRAKFREIHGVAPVGAWVNEHFGADRGVKMVELPVFKAAFIENQNEDGVWIYEERPVAPVEAEPAPAPRQPAAVVNKNKPKTFELAQKGVDELQQLLEACGGSAEFSELQDMYTERFGGFLDEEWMEEHFGCSTLLSLALMPIVNSLLVLEKNDLDMWHFRLLTKKAPKYPRHAPVAVDEDKENLTGEGGHGAHHEKASIEQLVRMLVDLGGVAVFKTLKRALKEHLKLGTSSVEHLQKKKTFKDQVEVLENGDEVRLCLRLEDHWTEVEDRFLKLLDYCDGQCTTSRFAQIYYRRYGAEVDLKNNLKEIIHRLPGKLISIGGWKAEIGGESVAVPVLKGPEQEMHVGRKRIFEALKKAGGRANVKELRISYEKLYPTTSLSSDWENYFGSKDEDVVFLMLNNDKMFILRTERGDELFLKPDCKGFYKEISIASFGSILFPPYLSDEEIFSHQCTYVADRVERTLQQLGGSNGHTRFECWELIKNGSREDACFAKFVRSCPHSLFNYMIRSKASMQENIIYLLSQLPVVSEVSKHENKKEKLTEKNKQYTSKAMAKNEKARKERQRLNSYYDAEDQLMSGKGHKTDYAKLVNKY